MNEYFCPKDVAYTWMTGRQCLSFLYVPKNEPPCLLMSCQHNISCRWAWSGWQNLMTCWSIIRDIFLTHQHVMDRHVIWGVWQHDMMPNFQLRLYMLAPIATPAQCQHWDGEMSQYRHEGDFGRILGLGLGYRHGVKFAWCLY